MPSVSGRTRAEMASYWSIWAEMCAASSGVVGMGWLISPLCSSVWGMVLGAFTGSPSAGSFYVVNERLVKFRSA